MISLRALHIEDSERDHQLFRRHILTNGIELATERVDTLADVETALANAEWDIVICDYSMPNFGAPQALECLKRLRPDIPFIIISGTVGEEDAVAAMRAGANDYLMKDNLARLVPAIRREINEAENRKARALAEIEQKRLDAELNRERERLENIVNTIPGVIWEGWSDTPNPPRNLDFVSDYVEKLLGYSLEEWQNTPDFWLSVVHPDDREMVRQAAEAHFTRGEAWRAEFRWMTKDGGIVWVESQAVVVKEGEGLPLRVRGLNLDITERKRAELALRESEERFRSLFMAIPQPVWVYDIETLSFRDMNDAAIQQYGYCREDFLSMTIKDIRPAEDIPVLLEQISDPARPTGPQGIWQHRKKDGSLIYAEVDSHDLLFEGKACKLVAATDVTDRKLAERELIESEERYRYLVENAHDIIFSHDLEGKYTSINTAGEQATGYTREEFLKLNILDTVAPEFVETIQEKMAAKLTGAEGTAHDLDIVAKDGTRISFEVTTKIVLHDGVPVGVQGIARDITARKRLEEQLRQAQKLESVGRLAGGIAHDFNNMLTAINGYTDLTLRQLPADHRVRRNLEEIKKAGERSTLLTNQLLAFSRRQLLQPEVVDLNDVIAETIDMLKRVIGENIELITELHPHVGSVKADKGQISQIILNLVVNSRDAMPKGGRLTIVTGNTFVHPQYADTHPDLLPGAYVKLVVSDTGTGIAESDLDHIFEPFFTTKEVGKGTGLGLATVYGIVKQSGGGITVMSRPGEGTTFELLLPRVKQHASKLPAIHADSNRLPIGPETILLVEDEDLVRSFMQQLLEACGYNVIPASDGAAAVAICEQITERIDLLITDVVMPLMGGRELAEKLNVELPELPVLFVSGYTDDALVRERVLDSGVNFIQKPFTLEAMSKKVRELLDSNKPSNN